jgi:cation-transporting ATPase E
MNATELVSQETAANLILAGLALLLAAIGVVGWWVAAHPAKVLAFARWAHKHPRLLRAERRYRGQIEFLARRLQPEAAFGLTFTVGLAVLALSVWIFGGVLEDVIAHEEIALFDAPIVSYVATHRVSWVLWAMENITFAGNDAFLIALTVVGGLALRYRTGSWRPLFLLAMSVLGAILLELIAKHVVARPRPPAVWMAVPAEGFAFPSGHSTASTAAYGALAYLTARSQSSWREKVGSLTAGALIAFLIGVSRVYLGVHWPSDVMAGWALGSAWLAIVFATDSTIESTATTAPLQTIASTANRVQREREKFYRSRPEVALEGLTADEVQVRIARGETNSIKERTSRSVAEIVRANVFTRFNALLGSLVAIMLWVGPPQDALFGVVLLVNTLIGVVQELRAKLTLDHLVLLAVGSVRTLRDGRVRELPVDQIVLDDILDLSRGDQVPVDCVVVVATGFEVDESLVTGEAEPVNKLTGDEVLSGTLVVAGSARLQATRVGIKSYARNLAAKARRFTPSRSEIREGIDRIITYVTWLVIPTALLVLATQLFETHAGWHDLLASSVAAVVGMVPEGLVLLTTIAFAAAVIRLGQWRVLVQELPAVETLARVDVVCLDKTGTLTDGRIRFERLVRFADDDGATSEGSASLDEALSALARLDLDSNASARAIAEAIEPPPAGKWKPVRAAPFSSARKWSALTFENHGTWILGAPEILLKQRTLGDPFVAEAGRVASTGRRVLVFAHSPVPLAVGPQPLLPDELTPLALVVLAERLRSEAVATLAYFAEQRLRLKVISGDSPQTVSAVATAAGISGAENPLSSDDLSEDPEALGEMVEKHEVFARVSPQQKRILVAALKRRGHTVAMVGDGVNDVLALKEADIGVAVASGTAAARSHTRSRVRTFCSRKELLEQLTSAAAS